MAQTSIEVLTEIGQAKIKASLVGAGLIGLVLGVIGGAVSESWTAVISTAVLTIVFGAYNQTLKHNNGIIGGVIAGGILGLFVSIPGLPISRNINGILDGALFGSLSGIIAGGVIGIITHAQPQDDDSLITKIILVVGSIGLGAFLGAGVGFTSGVILGVISVSWQGAIVAALAGGIVGAYIGSYYKKLQWIVIGAVSLALTAGLSSLVGGALAGLVLGLISGSFAPMLFVALIGAYGGLASRGPVAMVVEAIEAPSEMLTQGAVPFLVPAMMVGMMVGTAASGIGSLIVLPTSLALVGLMLGVFGELEGKPNNQVTVRSIVEMTMMGADKWPIRQVLQHVTQVNRKEAIIGAGISFLAAIASSVVGLYLGQLLRQLGMQFFA